MNFDAALDAIAHVDGDGVDLGEVEPAYPDFPLDEYRRRWRRVATLMERAGLDVLVLTQEESIRYLSGYNSLVWATGEWLPGVLLVARDPRRAVLLHSAFDAGCARGTAWVAELDGYTDALELAPKVIAHLKGIAGDSGRVGMEVHANAAVALPWLVAEEIVSAAGADVGDATAILSAVRMLKSDRELERIRRVVGATVAGYRTGLAAARGGMTEKELLAIVGTEMHANGATAGTRPLFLNCVSGPDRYALADAPASDRRLQQGDIVFVDGGGGCDGYMSDLIRLIAVGEISPDAEHYAEAALGAAAAMVGAARPGLKASELYEAGLAHYRAAGLEASAGALFGHGIGMQLWERPFIRRHDDADEDVRLRAGMTICLEPMLAPVDGAGSLAGLFVFEDQVAVTRDGCEVLSADLPRMVTRAPAQAG
jgi:Xaa-Pro aminopeptidase